MPLAYYNERDPYAAQWLRNLIQAGAIAPGIVDERDILDIRPADLDGFTQCHFFAGIGVWSRALREAGWPDDRPVWTGSCPCQPFSAAGARLAMDDERHLWPGWQWLIEQCRPETIFGEQVASLDGLGWADVVQADLEATDYACGLVDTCGASFRSFHIRQRLYFVAEDLRPTASGMGEPQGAGLQTRIAENATGPNRIASGRGFEPTGNSSGLVDASGPRLHGGRPGEALPKSASPERSARRGDADGLADAESCDGRLSEGPDGSEMLEPVRGCQAILADPSDGYWRDADWLLCRDGKWRPVRPSSFPLAAKAPQRVGRLRAYGNGLDLAQAAGFVRAYLERDMGPPPIADTLFEWSA